MTDWYNYLNDLPLHLIRETYSSVLVRFAFHQLQIDYFRTFDSFFGSRRLEFIS